MVSAPDPDNGFLSRKFWLLQEFFILLTLGYVATAKWDAFKPEFATYGGLLLAGTGLYFGVNVVHKALVKTPGLEQTEEVSEEDEEPTPPPKPKS
jgi:hypothetical protein